MQSGGLGPVALLLQVATRGGHGHQEPGPCELGSRPCESAQGWGQQSGQAPAPPPPAPPAGHQSWPWAGWCCWEMGAAGVSAPADPGSCWPGAELGGLRSWGSAWRRRRQGRRRPGRSSPRSESTVHCCPAAPPRTSAMPPPPKPLPWARQTPTQPAGEPSLTPDIRPPPCASRQGRAAMSCPKSKLTSGACAPDG